MELAMVDMRPLVNACLAYAWFVNNEGYIHTIQLSARIKVFHISVRFSCFLMPIIPYRLTHSRPEAWKSSIALPFLSTSLLKLCLCYLKSLIWGPAL